MARARARRAEWLRQEADAALAENKPEIATFLLRRATFHLDPQAPSSAPTRPLR